MNEIIEIICNCEPHDYTETLQAIAGRIDTLINQSATLENRTDIITTILLSCVGVAVAGLFCYIIYRFMCRFI